MRLATIQEVQSARIFRVQFPYDKNLVSSIKRCPGARYNPDSKTWDLLPIDDNREWLEANDFVIQDTELQDVTSKLDRIKRFLKSKPRQYQWDGIRYCLERNCRAIIGDEMGLGKTLQAIAVMLSNPDIKRTVIVCPAMVKYVWKNQLWEHAKIRADVLEGRKPRAVYSKIVVINYDILSYWKDHLKKYDLLILDECHYVKNRKAKRTGAVKEIGGEIPHIIGLSGTPITSRPAEFFTILNILHPRQFTSFMKFGIRYCKGHKSRFGWQFKGATNTKELHDIVSHLCMIRRRKADVLKELPDKVRTVIPVRMSKEGIKNYAEVGNRTASWMSAFGGDKKKRTEALAMIEYLKQAAVAGKMESVVSWLKEWLEDCDEKLVLFTTHRQTIVDLMEYFPNICVKLDGSVSKNEREAAIQKFIEKPQIKFFIGNLKAAGTGIDGLQRVCSNVAFVELGWSPGDHVQAEDRLHRIGQKGSVGVYYLVAENTIEEDIAKIIDTKRKVVDQVLDGRNPVDSDLLLELMGKWRG